MVIDILNCHCHGSCYYVAGVINMIMIIIDIVVLFLITCRGFRNRVWSLFPRTTVALKHPPTNTVTPNETPASSQWSVSWESSLKQLKLLLYHMAIHQHEAFVNQFQYLGHDPMVPRRDSPESLLEAHCRNMSEPNWVEKKNVVPIPSWNMGALFYGSALIAFSVFEGTRREVWSVYSEANIGSIFEATAILDSKCPNIQGLGGFGGLQAGTIFLRMTL